MKSGVIRIQDYRKTIKCIKIISILALTFLIGNFIAKLYTFTDSYEQAVAILNDKKVIVLDAGHGGEDPGAIGVSGVYEKDLNLQITKEIGRILSDCGYAVVYTRTTDKLLYNEDENIYGFRKSYDLKNRCRIAAEYENSIFVSIHMNSYKNEKYQGSQIYYSTNNSESLKLATTIQDNIKTNLQPNNTRTVKKGENIYILENIQNTAVLIECGFLSNEEECLKLSEKEYQKRLSLSIVYGIIKYIENTK